MRKIVKNWQDYEILDFGEGVKFERWNNIIVGRPDPLALGKTQNFNNLIQASDIYYNDKTEIGRASCRERV